MDLSKAAWFWGFCASRTLGAKANQSNGDSMISERARFFPLMCFPTQVDNGPTPFYTHETGYFSRARPKILQNSNARRFRAGRLRHQAPDESQSAGLSWQPATATT
jgi:hypothetical protein